MTTLERWLGTIRFEPVDRVPYNCELIWRKTIDRWISEGLPAEAVPESDPKFGRSLVRLDKYFDCDGCDRPEPTPALSINYEMIPGFEHEIFAEDELTITERGGDGMVYRRFKESPETSMAEFIDHPVHTRDDWRDIKRRYDPATPGRIKNELTEDFAVSLNSADYAVGTGANGLYWHARNLLGAEGLLFALYDDPYLVHDIMEHHVDFIIELLRPVVDKVHIRSFGLPEDMAYRNASLISPAMYREFMLPPYRRLFAFLRDSEVEHICIDSDGLLDELLPLFLEAGANAISPVEIQCGNDPVAIRKKFGRSLVIHGGINKYELAKERANVRLEMERKVPWLLEQGGYFPGLDHTVPYDVPFENFCYYMELKRKMIGA
jgi:hypothetical protein